MTVTRSWPNNFADFVSVLVHSALKRIKSTSNLGIKRRKKQLFSINYWNTHLSLLELFIASPSCNLSNNFLIFSFFITYRRRGLPLLRLRRRQWFPTTKIEMRSSGWTMQGSEDFTVSQLLHSNSGIWWEEEKKWAAVHWERKKYVERSITFKNTERSEILYELEYQTNTCYIYEKI